MFLAVAMQLEQTYQSSESFHSQQTIQSCARRFPLLKFTLYSAFKISTVSLLYVIYLLRKKRNVMKQRARRQALSVSASFQRQLV